MFSPPVPPPIALGYYFTRSSSGKRKKKNMFKPCNVCNSPVVKHDHMQHVKNAMLYVLDLVCDPLIRPKAACKILSGMPCATMEVQLVSETMFIDGGVELVWRLKRIRAAEWKREVRES